MLGVVINALAVFLSGLIGHKLAHYIEPCYKDAIMKFLPLTIIVIGIESALKGDMMIVLISIIIGVVIGEYFDLEGKLNNFANLLKDKFMKDSDSDFATGFVSGTLIFCVGSFGILGAIEAGVNGDISLLITKAVLDSLSSLFLSTTLGLGVACSAGVIFLYEGLITILAGFLAPILSPEILANISGVGGITIIAIGLSMLDLVKFKLVNSLPAIAIPVIIGLIMNLL